MREIDAGGAKLQRGIIEKVEKSTVIIEVIQEVIEMLKTVFIEAAPKLCGVSKERIIKTLDAHPGIDWIKSHRRSKRKIMEHKLFV